MSRKTDLQAWIAGGPKPPWVAANANPTYIANMVHNFGVDYALAQPLLTDNHYWTNTASTHAAPDRLTATTALISYVQGGPAPAWFTDLPADQQQAITTQRGVYAQQAKNGQVSPEFQQYINHWAVSVLTSGANSGVYQGGAAYNAAGGGTDPTKPGGTPAPAPGAPGFTPGAAVTPQGGLDEFQPFGQGFGTDGLTPGDANFAFGSGSTAPPTGSAPAAAGTPALGGAAAPAPAAGGNVGHNGPAPTVPEHYSAAPGGPGPGGPNTSGAVYGESTSKGDRVTGTGNSGGTTGGGGTQDQQNALATLRQTLNTYGLGSLADWAWGEIVAGKSEQQVLLDLMQTPQFKARFPSIEARQKAGLPPISPGEIVNYEQQATQVMRAAGLPSGFWDSPADFTHLLNADVSINELSQRVNLAAQAAYQVPPEVRATLARDYGVGPGQLAAFFLDEKTALPLITRDFTAAQIGGAAFRTGYGSTRAEDEHLTDLGVTDQQAQQGFTQLVGQRQLFSSLPGEHTSGISRDDQLAATFGGNSQAQERVVRRARERVGEFSGGGTFGSSAGGFSGIGQAQGA